MIADLAHIHHAELLTPKPQESLDFFVDALGYRLDERIALDDGSEAGAWMSLSVMAHELIYTQDALHAFWVDTREECLRAADLFLDHGVYIEAAPSKHAIAQGFFLYGYEPGGNRIEVTTGGYLVYGPEHPTVVWTEAERARSQAWACRPSRASTPTARRRSGETGGAPRWV